MIDHKIENNNLNLNDESWEFSVVFVFKKPIEIFGYGIRSALDRPEHDPRKWSIHFKLSKTENSTETETHVVN